MIWLKYPEKSVDLIQKIAEMSDGQIKAFGKWCEENNRGFSYETVIAFLLGVRPEFLNCAYNFDSTDFKTGFFVQNGIVYDLYFLSVNYAIDLLFNEIYGGWRKHANMVKFSSNWQKQVKTLIKLGIRTRGR